MCCKVFDLCVVRSLSLSSINLRVEESSIELLLSVVAAFAVIVFRQIFQLQKNFNVVDVVVVVSVDIVIILLSLL